MNRKRLYRITALGLMVTGALLIVASVASAGGGPRRNRGHDRLGGENTVFDQSAEAFTHALPGYDEADLARFEAGDELFELAFVAASGDPAATDDGLGPLFNADACESCHVEDGRGRPPAFYGETETGFLLRVALPDRQPDGHTYPDPSYGGQFQELATGGIAPEGMVRVDYSELPGTFADGTPYALRVPTYRIENLYYGAVAGDVTLSPRVANQMIGLGLLEAIPEGTIRSFADPNDADGDGISGRPNYVWDVLRGTTVLGRFGWKASAPTLLQQTAGAYNQDMGITSSLFPGTSCTPAQTYCLTMASGGDPELSDEHLNLVTFYSSSLAVPAQRLPEDRAARDQIREGERVFEQARCNACHIPTLETGLHPTIPQLSNQTIHPYTDLLLHDMGPGLADGQSDFEASGQEWRTPPLWGTGLFETVNGHSFYLHDGRARSLLEAVLWHGGEAATSRDFVLNLNAARREALLAFLRSL